MRKNDFEQFSKLLDASCDLLSRGGYTPNPMATAMFFNALLAFDFESVRAAFNGHIKDPQRGRFVPVPADILAQIQGEAATDGRPEPDEAWALAYRAMDEVATVIWTTEIAEAFGVCRPILSAGDKVGARMAFKSAYTRLVEEARAARRSMRWDASLGHDVQEQAQVLARHVAQGRIGQSVTAMLAPPVGQSIGLLELANSPNATMKARASLLAIREKIIERQQAMSADACAKAETARLQANAQALTDRFQQADEAI